MKKYVFSRTVIVNAADQAAAWVVLEKDFRQMSVDAWDLSRW